MRCRLMQGETEEHAGLPLWLHNQEHVIVLEVSTLDRVLYGISGKLQKESFREDPLGIWSKVIPLLAGNSHFAKQLLSYYRPLVVPSTHRAL